MTDPTNILNCPTCGGSGHVDDIRSLAGMLDPAKAPDVLRRNVDALPSAPKHGDDAVDGLRYVLCKVGFGHHYKDWLLIPHADGQYVTAAKLEPFSMGVLTHAMDAVPAPRRADAPRESMLFSLGEAKALVSFFGGSNCEVMVAEFPERPYENGDVVPAGKYAWAAECPEEGSQWLGEQDFDTEKHDDPTAPREAAQEPGHVAMLRSLRMMYHDEPGDEHLGTKAALNAAIEALSASQQREGSSNGWDAADACEEFLAAEIDGAPEPLRRLGTYLCAMLDDDHFRTADRMLIAAMLETSAAVRAASAPLRPVTDEDVIEAISDWKDTNGGLEVVMRTVLESFRSRLAGEGV